MLYVKIPKDRVGILIGSKGATRQQLEKRSGVPMDIDSRSGDITLHDERAKDPGMSLKMRDVVQAIGRGFSPEHAMLLFNEEYYLFLMDMREFVGKESKDVRRMKARLIGTKGKTRKLIEDMTGSYVSIYEETVGVIGDLMGGSIAKTAVEMLLNGSEHSSVHRLLESKRQQLRIAEMGFDYYERKD